jgi:hypothetical protein
MYITGTINLCATPSTDIEYETSPLPMCDSQWPAWCHRHVIVKLKLRARLPLSVSLSLSLSMERTERTVKHGLLVLKLWLKCFAMCMIRLLWWADQQIVRWEICTIFLNRRLVRVVRAYSSLQLFVRLSVAFFVQRAHAWNIGIIDLQVSVLNGNTCVWAVWNYGLPLGP